MSEQISTLPVRQEAADVATTDGAANAATFQAELEARKPEHFRLWHHRDCFQKLSAFAVG